MFAGNHPPHHHPYSSSYHPVREYHPRPFAISSKARGSTGGFESRLLALMLIGTAVILCLHFMYQYMDTVEELIAHEDESFISRRLNESELSKTIQGSIRAANFALVAAAQGIRDPVEAIRESSEAVGRIRAIRDVVGEQTLTRLGGGQWHDLEQRLRTQSQSVASSVIAHQHSDVFSPTMFTAQFPTSTGTTSNHDYVPTHPEPEYSDPVIL